MAKTSIKVALAKADALVKKGRAHEARGIYQTILRAQPDNTLAAKGLAATEKSLAGVVAVDPPKPVLDEVLRMLRGQKAKQAAVRAKTLLKKFPNSPNLWNLRALACSALSRFDEAVAASERIVALSPNAPEAHLNLGNALRKVERFEAATFVLQKALELKPNYPFAYNSLGNVQADQSMFEAAIENFSKAITLNPKYAEAYCNLGSAQVSLGQLDEAIESFQASVDLNPDLGIVYFGMSALKKLSLKDPVVGKMLALHEKAVAQDNAEQRIHFCFALAKVYRDNGDYEISFKYLKEGNEQLAGMLRYDPAADGALFKDIKSAAPRIMDASFDVSSDPQSIVPIFILGMPRSGTTLTEQILACHSEVTAAGELGLVNEFGADLVRGKEVPSQTNLMQFRERYFQEIAHVSGGKRYVTDKMPHNFKCVGLIRKAIPEAIIINLKRDPAAVCWSNYWQFFPRRTLGYSTGIETTVAYFGMYEDLMRFWQKHLPDEVNVLDYDRLVEFQEEETRALLEFCGLSWQDACLSPHKKKRSIDTASRLQVTQPVYTGSSEAWKAYAPYLDGAFDVFKTDNAASAET